MLPFDGETPGEPLAETGADGVGEGAEAGAVGVGTGGWSHRHSGSVGFTVRTGLACRGAGGIGAGRSPAIGSPRPSANAGEVGTGDVAYGRVRGTDGPIPESAVATGGAGGKVPAAAGVSSRSGTNPFTTTRYAPAAPSTVSSPNAENRAARRGCRCRRRGAGARPATGSSIDSEPKSHACPPNVHIPVEVTSGPPAGGSDGRRPMS